MVIGAHVPASDHVALGHAGEGLTPKKKMTEFQSRYVLRPHRSASWEEELQPKRAPSLRGAVGGGAKWRLDQNRWRLDQKCAGRSGGRRGVKGIEGWRGSWLRWPVAGRLRVERWLTKGVVAGCPRRTWNMKGPNDVVGGQKRGRVWRGDAKGGSQMADWLTKGAAAGYPYAHIKMEMMKDQKMSLEGRKQNLGLWVAGVGWRLAAWWGALAGNFQRT